MLGWKMLALASVQPIKHSSLARPNKSNMLSGAVHSGHCKSIYRFSPSDPSGLSPVCLGGKEKEKKTMAEPSSGPAKSDAEIEEILDRMLTRLALCDDSKLEALLSKLLPYSIASLSSQSSAVRNKVRSLPFSIFSRVKGNWIIWKVWSLKFGFSFR